MKVGKICEAISAVSEFESFIFFRSPGGEIDGNGYGTSLPVNINYGECCGGAGVPQRYCDLPYGGPEVLGEIIGDLRCVFEKCFGNQASAEDKFRDIQHLSDQIKQEFCALFCLKEELEYEIVRLHPELKNVRSALDDEVRRIAELARIVNQLKAQLVRADAMLDASCRDKAALQSQFLEYNAEVDRLEAEIKKLENRKHALESEAFQLRTEITKEAPNHMISNKCEALEEALAKCVRLNDEFGQKLANLERINQRLQQDLKGCESNRQRLRSELERCNRCARKEIHRLNDLIADLRKAVDCLTKHNAELCKKFQEVINGHQSELQDLHEELAKYKALLDSENKLRAQAEQALRESGPGPHRRSLSPSVPRRHFNCEAPCIGLFERIQYALADGNDYAPCLNFLNRLGFDDNVSGLNFSEEADQEPGTGSGTNSTDQKQLSDSYAGRSSSAFYNQTADLGSGQSTEVLEFSGPSNSSNSALAQTRNVSLEDEASNRNQHLSSRTASAKKVSIDESSLNDTQKAPGSTSKLAWTSGPSDRLGTIVGIDPKTGEVCKVGPKSPGNEGQLSPLTLKTPGGSNSNFSSKSIKTSKKGPSQNKPGGSGGSGGNYQTYPVMVKYNIDPKTLLASKNKERQKSRIIVQAKGVDTPVSTTTLDSRLSQNSMESSDTKTQLNYEKKAKHYQLLNQKSEQRIKHLKEKLEREKIKQHSLMEHNESMRQELQNTNEQIQRLSQISHKSEAVLRCIP